MSFDWKNKNDLSYGVIVGLVTPILGFLVSYTVFGLMVHMDLMDDAHMGFFSKRMRTIILIGICFNIYWIQKYNSRFTSQTSRGIVLATMGYCVAWFAVYFSSLYED